ncbi:MAG: hypothetical protein ABH854_02710 [Candidatus Diapherotrites archaeon]|nr:hypothetical protein [Candidatus Micrarchaeota archaeon]MBU1939340.1 hypothetical protein [Candidatus Micrarchaeota archaeon]
MGRQEFWHESLTEESWKKLGELSRETDFAVIGGWSVWLWTRQHKSRDIDIVIGFGELAKLREKYAVEKNNRLRKYEIKMQGFDVDIYVPFYSKLALPVEELLNGNVKIEGINTVSCEALLVLKQGAEKERRGTAKGMKDLIDILTILIYAPVDFKKYFGLLKKHKKEGFARELIAEIAQFNPADSERYLGLKYAQFRKRKRELIEKIKKLR